MIVTWLSSAAGWALVSASGVMTASGSMPFQRPIKVTDRSWPNLSTREAEHGPRNEPQCLEVKSYILVLPVLLLLTAIIDLCRVTFSDPGL